MSIANNQLEEIFEETRQRFSNTNLIQIKPLEGTPPEKYEIQYFIKGLHKEDGAEPVEIDTHVVTISIPFGFPHFPPSCTPNSPIYHPDFDPAAICIGDFWDQDKSLSDLIVYIGQLIAGENYSTENAFNEDAAKWYAENSSSLPFSTLEIETAAPVESESAMDDIGDMVDDLELDVIDDSDLEDDFSYLSIDDAPDDDLPPVIPMESEEHPEVEDEVDHDLILLMRKKKRFYALNEYLVGLSPSIQFSQREQIEKLVNDELENAQALYGQAEEFEHQGKPEQSLAKYKEVSSVVSDFPSLNDDIARAEQAVELLGGMSDDQSGTAETSEEGSPEAEKQDAIKETPDKKLTFFEDENSKRKMGAMPIAFGVVAVLFILTGVYLYFSINGQYNKADQLYQRCQQALNKQDFFNTDKYCSEALGAVKKVQFLKSGDKEALTSSIESILESRTLKEGLAGNIKYEGKYIPVSSLESIKQFNTLKESGQKAFESEEWDRANQDITQALAIAKTNLDIDRELLPPLEAMNNIAVFNHSYKSGVEFTRQQNWSESSEQLNNALKALALLDQETQKKYTIEIGKLHEEATFYSLEAQANQFFESGQWQQATSTYQETLQKAPNFLISHPDKKTTVHQQVTKAVLYQTIQSGKEAFAKSDWDAAIKKYDAAIKTLNENQEMLKQGNSKENKMKLSRIKLQASIIRDQQNAARKLKKKQFTDAVKTLQSINTSINSSQFKNEEEFITIRTETNLAIAAAQEEQFIIDKTGYLMDNYLNIFLENYPNATADSLQDPKVDFVKRIDNNLLFKLQCLEKGRGRPLRLVINYLYNPDTDKWTFYNQ